MKILVFSISVVFFILGLYVVDVSAQDLPLPAPWELQSNCGPGQVKPNQVSNVASNPGKIIQELNNNGSCVEGDIQITNFQTIAGVSVDYCPNGLIAPRNDDGRYNKAKCCPSTHPNSNITSGTLCCRSGRFPNGDNCVAEDGSFESGVSTVNTVADRDISIGAPILQGSGPYYSCPSIGCVLDAFGNIVPNNTESDLVTFSTLNGRVCLEERTPNPADPNLFCLQNEWLNAEDLRVALTTGGVGGCSELKDEAEKQRCLECFANNTPTEQYYVYSSIGCVDTRQNQFITRLFQIGLGLIGGLAVIRIMWGEVLRQSGKPEKIEEGREMEVAAFIALAVVVTAIPLLRFIGINLLQILPISFLQ